MHLKSGFSLALLSTAATLTCGFSLQPFQKRNSLITSSSSPLTTIHKNKPAAVSMLHNKSLSNELRGGSLQASSINGEVTKKASPIISFWAAGGVVMILAKSIKRIVPIALEPFQGVATPLSTFQLASYIAMCIWFAYVEGYKGFQLKFSPLVVSRAQTLTSKSPIHHLLFAPFYAMGLFHATKKRKIVSWSVSTGVAVIVAAVKKLPYPWRNIVDAGVIVGLTWGSISILSHWIKAVVFGKDLNMDPALPEKKD